MAMSGGRDDGEPMMEINTTPLIDVMLVLLIMFIITIPVQTHAVKVDLPVNQPNQPPPVNPTRNKIVITPDGAVLWNGTPVSEQNLAVYLAQTRAMNPEPELHFQPDSEARYEVVDRTLAVIRRSQVTKLGFIGNEQYATAF